MVKRSSRRGQKLTQKVRFNDDKLVIFHGSIYSRKPLVIKKDLCKLNGDFINSLSSPSIFDVPLNFLHDVHISQCNIESTVNDVYLSHLVSSSEKRDLPDPSGTLNVSHLLSYADIEVNTLNGNPINKSLVPLNQKVKFLGDISFAQGSEVSTAALKVTGEVLAHTNIEMLLPKGDLKRIEQFLDAIEPLLSPSANPMTNETDVTIDYQVYKGQVYVVMQSMDNSSDCSPWRKKTRITPVHSEKKLGCN